MKRIFLILVPVLLGACASQSPAPVVDRSPPPALAKPVTPVVAVPVGPVSGAPGTYTVKKGDTLYRIALDHGVYYRDLSAWNGLQDANNIKEGQVLRVIAPGGETTAVAVTQPIASGAPVESKAVAVAAVSDAGIKREPKVNKEAYSDAAWDKIQKPADAVAKAEAKSESKPEVKVDAKPAETIAASWAWPAAGKVSASFSEGGNKGIDITGKDGDAINAVAEGKVYFVGVQKGYGNLLIIGHANGYISVYAHNRKVLVSEKQIVSKGQKVAEMGKTESENGVKLHFEIRLQGKPVDPMLHLPKR